MNSRKNIVTLVGIISILTIAAVAEVRAEIVDRIVAVVNKTVITEYQIQQTQQNFMQEGAPEESLTRESVLNFLIEQELVLQEAARMGLLVTDEELNAALENIKQQNNLTSDEQLKSALAGEGKTLTDFKEDVRQQIRLAKIVGQEVRSKVDVSDAEVDAYYDEHRDEFARPAASGGVSVRQILLTLPENADAAHIDQVRGEAQALVQQLREGADFADMARRHSQHSTAASGGELGTFKPGELAAPFDIAFRLQAGEVSDPIQTDNGFSIIAAQPSGDNGEADLLRIKSQIRNGLFEEKSQQQYVEWIATLKDKAYLDVK